MRFSMDFSVQTGPDVRPRGLSRLMTIVGVLSATGATSLVH